MERFPNDDFYCELIRKVLTVCWSVITNSYNADFPHVGKLKYKRSKI